MSEKPILFNTEMVRAILSGRKTQTRRVVKPQPKEGFTAVCDPYNGFYEYRYGAGAFWKTSLCAIDDVLWVRETWDYGYFERSDLDFDYSCWFESVDKDRAGDYVKAISRYIYRADFTLRDEAEYGMEDCHGNYKMTWRPSIHMPREAARLFLRVTGVRIERLQAIQTMDAVAEGADARWYQDEWGNPIYENTPIDVFSELWDSTIKKSDLPLYGWDANPWVWVINFEKIDRPEAQT